MPSSGVADALKSFRLSLAAKFLGTWANELLFCGTEQDSVPAMGILLQTYRGYGCADAAQMNAVDPMHILHQPVGKTRNAMHGKRALAR